MLRRAGDAGVLGQGAGSRTGRRARRRIRGAWGTLLLTLLVSWAGRTFLVTARFCSGRTFGAMPRMLQSMPSNSRPAASQARKSGSGSRVVERRGGGGRSGVSQSLRCRIFSMTDGLSMKPMMRNRPPHLGQASGSAARTLRINRARARLQWGRKSSGSGSSPEAATGVMPAAFCCRLRRCPRALLL